MAAMHGSFAGSKGTRNPSLTIVASHDPPASADSFSPILHRSCALARTNLNVDSKCPFVKSYEIRLEFISGEATLPLVAVAERAVGRSRMTQLS